MLISTSFTLNSCQHKDFQGFTHVLDSRNPNYEAPIAVLNDVDDIIYNSYVYFSWVNGNDTDESSYNKLYAYMLKGYDTAYCEWEQTTYADYSNLEEGQYTFYVKGKTANVADEKPDSTTFTINALRENSIALKPYRQEVDANTEASVELWFEDVTDLKGLAAQIDFSNSCEILRIEKNDTLLSQGATNMLFLTNSIAEINSSKIIIIDLALLGTSENGFSGTAPACKIYFKCSGDFTFSFVTNQTKMRGTNNDFIWIPDYRGSEVAIR